MTLNQLMSAHDRAHARTVSFGTLPEGVPFHDPRREENEDELASLTTAEDALMEKLAIAPCADDEAFFAKAAFILKYGDSGHDGEWAALRLADATRLHLKQRDAPLHPSAS